MDKPRGCYVKWKKSDIGQMLLDPGYFTSTHNVLGTLTRAAVMPEINQNSFSLGTPEQEVARGIWATLGKRWKTGQVENTEKEICTYV